MPVGLNADCCDCSANTVAPLHSLVCLWAESGRHAHRTLSLIAFSEICLSWQAQLTEFISACCMSSGFT